MFLVCILFAVFFSSGLDAQEEQAFVLAEYMKVKPGMHEKYRECEKVWKRIHEHRLEKGFITGWELERVVSPSGTNAEYDYQTITFYKSWDALDAETGDDWKSFFEILSEEERVIADQAHLFRDIVKREIWTGQEFTFAPDAENPMYRVENFMDIPAGGWDTWVEMEKKFAKPFIEKSIDMGNRAGWLIASLVLPRGADLPYQASTIDFYNSWEDMGKSDEEAWNAVYADMDEEQISKRINSTRTIVRSEVRRLVDIVK